VSIAVGNGPPKAGVAGSIPAGRTTNFTPPKDPSGRHGPTQHGVHEDLVEGHQDVLLVSPRWGCGSIFLNFIRYPWGVDEVKR
jgi:hypothetical protein